MPAVSFSRARQTPAIQEHRENHHGVDSDVEMEDDCDYKHPIAHYREARLRNPSPDEVYAEQLERQHEREYEERQQQHHQQQHHQQQHHHQQQQDDHDQNKLELQGKVGKGDVKKFSLLIDLNQCSILDNQVLLKQDLIMLDHRLKLDRRKHSFLRANAASFGLTEDIECLKLEEDDDNIASLTHALFVEDQYACSSPELEEAFAAGAGMLGQVLQSHGMLACGDVLVELNLPDLLPPPPSSKEEEQNEQQFESKKEQKQQQQLKKRLELKKKQEQQQPMRKKLEMKKKQEEQLRKQEEDQQARFLEAIQDAVQRGAEGVILLRDAIRLFMDNAVALEAIKEVAAISQASQPPLIVLCIKDIDIPVILEASSNNKEAEKIVAGVQYVSKLY